MILSRTVHFLPLLWFLAVCVAVFTPYIIAVSLDHVYPVLPTISLAAAFHPEGSIFGFFMTFVAFFGVFTICYRYLQLDEFQGDFETNSLQQVKCYNKLALLFGALCFLSVAVVANFRVPLNEKYRAIGYVHGAGTTILLISGVFYCWLQTLISYHSVKLGLNTKCMFVFRLALACILTLCAVWYPSLEWFSYTEVIGSNSLIKVANWNPKDSGYGLHVANCAAEWIACLSLGIFVASFYNDFQTFAVEVCCVGHDELKEKNNAGYSKIKEIRENE